MYVLFASCQTKLQGVGGFEVNGERGGKVNPVELLND